MPPETIRIVMIDDHPLVRAGMRGVLDSASDKIRVVAEGASGAEALHLVTQHLPDVLVLDVNLPDLNGVEVTRRLRAQAVTTAILILTVHDDDQTIFGLLEAGATGYVLKDDVLETLTSAVLAVARGQIWLSPKVARQVVRRAVGEQPPPAATDAGLTPRELEVLCLVARGLDNEGIAQKLTLTRRTVQNHVSAIYAKLGVKSRAEAVLYALRHQLTPGCWPGDTADAG